MSEPRPKLTPEIRLIAARRLVADLLKGGCLGPHDDLEGCAADIAAEGGFWTDGYSLAKSLDDHHGWSPTAEMVDILDSFYGYTHHALEAAEKEWLARNPVEPPLPVGARVKLKSGETGEITGIYEHGPAKFLVAIDGDKMTGINTSGRRIVNFEDAELLPAAAA